MSHSDGFGHCSGFVKQGSVGQWQTCDFCDHGLKIEKGFESTLADFRLVRRIGGVPRWILEHIALHHRGSDGAVVALTNQ